MAEFDRFAVVDWSGANTPKRGADSIWIAASARESVNPATRAEATDVLSALIADALRSGVRLMIGFDFAFGFPAGFARAVGLSGWEGVWAHLHARIEDGPDNRSNRFDVAAAWNRALPGEGPFWGYTMKRGLPEGLSRRSFGAWVQDFDYKRHAEKAERRASPVFKLAYTGSVGSQALLGIARLESLRRRFPGRIAVWPFETDFAADLAAPVVFTEIYPSRHDVPVGLGVKDRRQVEAVLRDFAAWNGPRLVEALSAHTLTKKARTEVRAEEGWVVGL